MLKITKKNLKKVKELNAKRVTNLSIQTKDRDMGVIIVKPIKHAYKEVPELKVSGIAKNVISIVVMNVLKL